MKEYRVIRNFEVAKVGDIFGEVEPGVYRMSKAEKVPGRLSERAMTIDQEIADSLVENDFLQEIVEEKHSITLDMINDLLKNYDQDFKDTITKYENKEIPTCVKVEAETVYYNLNKVLNRIKESLENEQTGQDC